MRHNPPLIVEVYFGDRTRTSFFAQDPESLFSQLVQRLPGDAFLVLRHRIMAEIGEQLQANRAFPNVLVFLGKGDKPVPMEGYLGAAKKPLLDPQTPVMPGAIEIWEREVARERGIVARAEARLAHATDYLQALQERIAKGTES